MDLSFIQEKFDFNFSTHNNEFFLEILIQKVDKELPIKILKELEDNCKLTSKSKNSDYTENLQTNHFYTSENYYFSFEKDFIEFHFNYDVVNGLIDKLSFRIFFNENSNILFFIRNSNINVNFNSIESIRKELLESYESHMSYANEALKHIESFDSKIKDLPLEFS